MWNDRSSISNRDHQQRRSPRVLRASYLAHQRRALHQRLLRSRVIIGWSLCAHLLWSGCDSAPRVTLDPPDVAEDDRDQESSDDFGLDQGPDEGVVSDLGPELDLSGLSDMDAMITDAYIPPAEPLPSERASVVWEGTLITVWRSDADLWRSSLPLSEIDVTLDDPQRTLDIRRGSRWLELPDTLRDVELSFHTTHIESPYLIISAPEREAVSARLTDAEPRLEQLGVTLPLAVTEGDGAVVIIGQLWSEVEASEEPEPELDPESNSEPESDIRSQIGWRFARNGVWGPIIEDTLGLRAAQGIVRALGGWVISAPEGLCYEMSERGGVSGSWRCEARGDSVMLGGVNSVTHWGAIDRPHQESQSTPGMWLWSGTPGRVIHPLDAESVSDPSLLTPAPLGASFTLPYAHIFLSDAGEIERWIARGDDPRVLWNTDDPERGERPLILSKRGYAPLPTSADVDSVIDLVELSDRQLLLTWSSSLGALEISELSEVWVERSLPSAPPLDEYCLVESERCDDIDHDCDGAPRNQLCCPEGEISSTRLQDVLFPRLDWWSSDSEIGLLAAIASQGRARLFSMSSSGGDATLRASWSGVDALERFGHYLSLIALIARDDEGAPYLLLNRREVDGDPTSDFVKRALSCEPRAVTVLDESHAVRVYCAEHSLLIETDGSESIEAYPEEGELQWATRRVEGNGRETSWLVALGEAHQLSVWRDQGRGGVSYIESDLISAPSSLGDLTPLDRMLPVQLPATADGLLARRVSDREVEVWVSGLGWIRLGGHRWPYWASISPAYSAAITVGYSEDPVTVGDSFLQRLNIRVHPLSGDGALLGHSLRERISRDSFGGAHFSRYRDESGGEPSLLTLIGGSIEFSDTVCR